MRRIAILLADIGLSGCAASYDRLQFKAESLALPANYLAQVQEAVDPMPHAGPLMVSEPRQTFGDSAFSAKLWYVCVLGISPGGRKPTASVTVADWVSGHLSPQPGKPNRYEVIVHLRGTNLHGAHAVPAFDSPLCAGGRYAPLGET